MAIPILFSRALSVAFILLGGLALAQTAMDVEVGRFSVERPGGPLPSGWRPLTFPNISRHTEYTLVDEDGVVVVKAVSQSAASGFVREVDLDPHRFPKLQWKWKIAKTLTGSDLTKRGDDYAARIYITFAYDASKVGFFEKAKYATARLLYGEYPPIAAINYIWASKTPVGTIAPNPYTDRAAMIVVQSGDGRANQWVTQERNIVDDYRAAFDDDPPMMSGVAIMTDTDNTGERAVAYYGDITFTR